MQALLENKHCQVMSQHQPRFQYECVATALFTIPGTKGTTSTTCQVGVHVINSVMHYNNSK